MRSSCGAKGLESFNVREQGRLPWRFGIPKDKGHYPSRLMSQLARVQFSEGSDADSFVVSNPYVACWRAFHVEEELVA